MIVTFAKNSGDGASTDVNAPENISVGDFVRQNMPGFNANNAQVMVNREKASPDDILEEGDHVAVIPTKVTGG